MNNQRNNRIPGYRLILLASLGAGLEWFDFTIYLLLASVISYNFFPHSDPLTALMDTFATFALGYLARPIGGVVFGYIGDKYGRKRAFTSSVFLMACATRGFKQ
jgi:MFS family permease